MCIVNACEITEFPAIIVSYDHICIWIFLTVFKDEFMLFHAQTSAKNIGCNHHRNHFYAPEGTSGGILKSNRPSVCLLQIVSQRYLINYWSKFDETSQKDKA